MVNHALILECCICNQIPRLGEATTNSIRIVDSRPPGFNGARQRVTDTPLSTPARAAGQGPTILWIVTWYSLLCGNRPARRGGRRRRRMP